MFSPIPNLDHRLREVLMAVRIRDNMALVGKSQFLGQALNNAPTSDPICRHEFEIEIETRIIPFGLNPLIFTLPQHLSIPRPEAIRRFDLLKIL